MEQQWCGKTQLSIHPQMFQYLDQYLIKPCYLDVISRAMNFFQSAGLLRA
jgi:hypothetical protein